ncbi:MAG: hypothetical protein PF694_04465 [Bacteroidetes bacterium]|jgi:hypothetical protein|nr:hypothetical protein [Bacteroidota bacterium]
MTRFDLAEFERQVDSLLSAHRRLLADYRELKVAHGAEEKRNRETRERLNAVIERLKALETEARNA